MVSSESKLVFREADALAMADLLSERAALVRGFVPGVDDAVTGAVGDWTGQSRRACDAALKRLKERGDELSDVLASASDAMMRIREDGVEAEIQAFAHVDS